MEKKVIYKVLGEALKLIKSECNEHVNCSTCPLYHCLTEDCVLNITPNNWDIKEEISYSIE